MRRVWILVALAGCRQVFGIDEPLPQGGASVGDARRDGHSTSGDGAQFSPGLAMYVLPNVALWSADQQPDAAWSLIDPLIQSTEAWTGTGPTLAQLIPDGVQNGKPFSVWMEGQVYAMTGQQLLEMTANNYAFFDAEVLPDSGVFQFVASSTRDAASMPATSSVTAGWYRVRIGWSGTNSMADLKIVHQGPQDALPVPFSATNLRH